LPGRSHPGHGGFLRFQVKRWIGRRLNRIRINLAFSRLNAVASTVFLIATLTEVVFQGGLPSLTPESLDGKT